MAIYKKRRNLCNGRPVLLVLQKLRQLERIVNRYGPQAHNVNERREF